MHILFDTNVLLDALLERRPHANNAATLLAAVETGKITGLVSATSLTTVYYIAERARGPKAALEAIRSLLSLFGVAPVTRLVLTNGLDLGFRDFEDAVLHKAARHAGADGVVTRNARDFAQATLAIYTPAELVQILQQADSSTTAE